MNNDFEIIPQEEIKAAEKTIDALLPDPSFTKDELEDPDVLAMILIATQRQNRC